MRPSVHWTNILKLARVYWTLQNFPGFMIRHYRESMWGRIEGNGSMLEYASGGQRLSQSSQWVQIIAHPFPSKFVFLWG